MTKRFHPYKKKKQGMIKLTFIAMSDDSSDEELCDCSNCMKQSNNYINTNQNAE